MKQYTSITIIPILLLMLAGFYSLLGCGTEVGNGSPAENQREEEQDPETAASDMPLPADESLIIGSSGNVSETDIVSAFAATTQFNSVEAQAFKWLLAPCGSPFSAVIYNSYWTIRDGDSNLAALALDGGGVAVYGPLNGDDFDRWYITAVAASNNSKHMATIYGPQGEIVGSDLTCSGETVTGDDEKSWSISVQDPGTGASAKVRWLESVGSLRDIEVELADGQIVYFVTRSGI